MLRPPVSTPLPTLCRFLACRRTTAKALKMATKKRRLKPRHKLSFRPNKRLRRSAAGRRRPSAGGKKRKLSVSARRTQSAKPLRMSNVQRRKSSSEGRRRLNVRLKSKRDRSKISCAKICLSLSKTKRMKCLFSSNNSSNFRMMETSTV